MPPPPIARPKLSRHTPLRERFMASFRCTHSCWLWGGALGSAGYGTIRSHPRQLRAHRVAYELLVGPIPAGKIVCHKCDTPRCVNPKHLWLGTPTSNMVDRDRKGRNIRGAQVNTAKLSPRQVLAIRRRYRGETWQTLAAAYGVSQSTISAVGRGKTWKHL